MSTITETSIYSVIGSPLILGTVSLIFCMAFFGLAINFDWIEDLAPRAANRPKAVMKNSILSNITDAHRLSSYKNHFSFYPIAWIIWAYNLTYQQCINGIPGTGTRNDGWSGPLLKINLDAVILLKFHALLFKISVLVAVLCLFILIPINTTAGCDVELFGNGTCTQHKNKSNGFYKTTIANIPTKIFNSDENITAYAGVSTSQIFDTVNPFTKDKNNYTLTDSNGTVLVMQPDTTKSLSSDLWVADQTWRVCATLICCLLIYAYTFYLLTREWIENVALRRTYFLEASHFGQRMRELNKLKHDVVDNKSKNAGGGGGDDDHIIATNNCDIERADGGGAGGVENKDEDESKDLTTESKTILPPYLTHPEIRETPPSVGIYSVLYQLPNSMVTYDMDGATSIERELRATTDFFDEIVPPQPGFSSSVVAVTVIPRAKLVARAWNKWSAWERKFQTLRHIRELIEKATEQQEPPIDDQQQQNSPSHLKRSVQEGGEKNEENKKSMAQEVDVNDDVDVDLDNEDDNMEELVTSETIVSSSGPHGETKVYNGGPDGDMEMLHFKTNDENEMKTNVNDDSPSGTTSVEQGRTVFKYEDFDVAEYAKALGFRDEVDNMVDFIGEMGIEEFSVFAYNCALLAGGPGLSKKRLNLCSLETLKEEEADYIEELNEAKEELIKARANVLAEDDDIELAIQPVASREEHEYNIHDGDSGLHFESSEYNFAEREVDAMIPNSESQIKGEPTGKIEYLLLHLKRIFLGADNLDFAPKYYGINTEDKGKAFITNLDHPSYAVVTFTSRHSAIIARQCLADGGGTNTWKQVDDIPIFPLADAPPMMCFPRGCLRPVTPTISYTSKKLRVWIVYIVLVLFTSFYVVPIKFINDFIWNQSFFDGLGLSPKLLPILSGLTQTLLFSICPTIFKFLADCEGSSSSMEKAEQKAMIFFWYFYICARFLGQLLWESVMKFTSGESNSVEQLVVQALSELSQDVPTVLGPAALTYIIFGFTITWPALYFLQFNNFLTKIFRLGWINRILKGGGPGAVVPYRIYVDSGYVFACMTALAPLCPLIGPFALLYYIVISPMLRWLVVFAYRPRFDGGGDKWPKLHHIIVTSLILGQVITAMTFLLKGNVIEGLIIGFCILPTLLYNSIILEKFLRPYRDAALLQTGRMYNAHQSRSDSSLEREEFRRWLVDCHKASYVPTCLSGGSKYRLTAEPAIVISKAPTNEHSEDNNEIESNKSIRNQLTRQKAQKGGILRRHRFNL